MLNRPTTSEAIKPTVKLRPLKRLRANAFGTNPSSSAAERTLARVSGRSAPRRLSTLDAVPSETPARAATSAKRLGALVSSRDMDVSYYNGKLSGSLFRSPTCIDKLRIGIYAEAAEGKAFHGGRWSRGRFLEPVGQR